MLKLARFVGKRCKIPLSFQLLLVGKRATRIGLFIHAASLNVMISISILEKLKFISGGHALNRVES